MSVSSQSNRASYIGTGSVTTFAFSPPFQMTADLTVLTTDPVTGIQSTKAITTDYTINGTTDSAGFYPNGGSVVFNVAPASGIVVTIFRDPPLTQTVVHVDGGQVTALSLDGPSDKLTMIAIRDRELINRSLRQPDGDVTALAILPPSVTRANGGLGSVAGYDGTGQPTVFPAAANGVQASTAMATVITQATLALARQTLAGNSTLDDIAVAAWAQGDVLYYNGTHLVRLAAGAAGKALVTGGASANPSWDFAGHGQCQLQFVSTTQIKLVPKNGNKVMVNGTVLSLASAGVTAANTSVLINGSSGSLAASTVYLVALNASGVLEFWTLATGHGPDSTAGNIGVEVITGHVDKSLVGMVITNGSSQFVDSGTQIGVISWFNRARKPITVALASNTTTTSTVYVELSTAMRAAFLCWADEAVEVYVNGYNSSNTASDGTQTSIGFDGTTAEDVTSGAINSAVNGQTALALVHAKTLAEGSHYATILAEAVNGGTGNWVGSATAGNRVTIKVVVRG